MKLNQRTNNNTASIASLFCPSNTSTRRLKSAVKIIVHTSRLWRAFDDLIVVHRFLGHIGSINNILPILKERLQVGQYHSFNVHLLGWVLSLINKSANVNVRREMSSTDLCMGTTICGWMKGSTHCTHLICAFKGGNYGCFWQRKDEDTPHRCRQ